MTHRYGIIARHFWSASLFSVTTRQGLLHTLRGNLLGQCGESLPRITTHCHIILKLLHTLRGTVGSLLLITISHHYLI